MGHKELCPRAAILTLIDRVSPDFLKALRPPTFRTLQLHHDESVDSRSTPPRHDRSYDQSSEFDANLDPRAGSSRSSALILEALKAQCAAISFSSCAETVVCL